MENLKVVGLKKLKLMYYLLCFNGSTACFPNKTNLNKILLISALREHTEQNSDVRNMNSFLFRFIENKFYSIEEK